MKTRTPGYKEMINCIESRMEKMQIDTNTVFERFSGHNYWIFLYSYEHTRLTKPIPGGPLIQTFPIIIYTKQVSGHPLFEITKNSQSQFESFLEPGVFYPLPCIQTTHRVDIENKATLQPIYKRLGITNVKGSAQHILDSGNTVLGIRVGHRDPPTGYKANGHILFFTRQYPPYSLDWPKYIAEDDDFTPIMDNWPLLDTRLSIYLPGIGQVVSPFLLRDPLRSFLEPVFQKWMAMK